jgi:hypothetical protein
MALETLSALARNQRRWRRYWRKEERMRRFMNDFFAAGVRRIKEGGCDCSICKLCDQRAARQ